jgi:hypothetical protein
MASHFSAFVCHLILSVVGYLRLLLIAILSIPIPDGNAVRLLKLTAIQ